MWFQSKPQIDEVALATTVPHRNDDHSAIFADGQVTMNCQAMYGVAKLTVLSWVQVKPYSSYITLGSVRSR